MAQQRVGGILYIKVNGQQLQVKGSWTLNLGLNKREAVVGADGTHGYKEMPQVAYIEGEITDQAGLDLTALFEVSDATITAELASNRVVVFRSAWFAGDGNITTEEGAIEVRFEALGAQEAK